MKTADPSLSQLLRTVRNELRQLDKRRKQIIATLDKVAPIVSRTATQDLTVPLKTTNGKNLRVKAVVQEKVTQLAGEMRRQTRRLPTRSPAGVRALTQLRKDAISKVLPLQFKHIWELTAYLWIAKGSTQEAFKSFIRDHFVRSKYGEKRVIRARRETEMRKKH